MFNNMKVAIEQDKTIAESIENDLSKCSVKEPMRPIWLLAEDFNKEPTVVVRRKAKKVPRTMGF